MVWQRSAGWVAVGLFVATIVCAQPNPVAAAGPGGHSSRTVQSAARTPKQILPRLASSDDGLAILGAALESRGSYKVRKRSDCSHLVHAIYEKAGFPYPYAPSSDLFVGAEGFERVQHPQPGDLVVWHGHSGIVVSPQQHTFFSALRTGLGVEDYDSAYWMGRGRPRFFRYVKQGSGTAGSGTTRTAGLKAADMRRR
jgi:cell wall-associated NlpC family hydrolase